MKIDRIDLPESITSKWGLQPVKMDRLNKVILVAGKNGSGKTRLINMLMQRINDCPTPNVISQIKENTLTYRKAIASWKNAITNNNRQLLTLPFNNDLNQQNADLERNIKQYEHQILNWEQELKKAVGITLIPEKEVNHTVDFVPKSLDLRDSYSISPQELDTYANQVYNIGTGSIAQSTIPAIELIQKRWTNANTFITDDLAITPEELNKINSDYEKLKRYVKLFLNTDLKRNKEGSPVLFDKRIGDAQLSNGQKILLQFCMALFAQEAKLEDVIIFMDEPENHLHPAAIIEVLSKITPHVKNGQIWIATHSINVLAHFDPSCIWYIDDGKVSYAGSIPRTVLEGLLGNEEEIEKLSHFLSLPAQMASNKFAFESLFYPNVVITGSEDHQVAQIHAIIKERSNNGNKLKVLDFGMGKGRLLSTIFENERLRNVNMTEWLDYYGFDKFDTHKEICEKVFLDIYGSAENRNFNQAKDLLAKLEENTFDIIVMCNVFHEIDPSEWLPLFNSVTSPFKLLKEEGFLLIVEDQFLAVGEKAHSKGFLIFDELEFKKLFKINNSDKYLSTDFRNDGRLKSHHIPKNCLTRIDASSKKEALQILHQNAMDEMKKLRAEKNPTFKTGKLHGFWSQQLANATLALEEL